MRRQRAGANGISPEAYVAGIDDRHAAVSGACDTLLNLWKGLWRYGLDHDAVELLAVLKHEFTGRIYYEEYSPRGQGSNTKNEEAHRMVDAFNDHISSEPLCFIAARYLTMEHLMQTCHVQPTDMPR